MASKEHHVNVKDKNNIIMSKGQSKEKKQVYR